VKTYVAVYFGAALIAMILTPILSRIAKARGIVDAPGVRKVHDRPIPRIGGLAILVATLSLVLGVLWLHNTVGAAFRQIRTHVLALLGAAVIMGLMGLVDDVRGLPARVKLAVQVLAAVAVCAFGIRIDEIGNGGIVSIKFGWLSWPVTVIWIVGITNAVNFIDGLDGLASGIAAMACGAIALFSLWSGQVVMAVLALALLGSLTGFLFFNFNPAKVFLGDGGTYFVGFTIAAASVLCAQKTAALVGLTLPVLALGVPIMDMLFSILRRVLERRSIMSADRQHIHHRLLRMGLRQRHVVLLIYLVTLLTAGIGTCMLIAGKAAPVLALLGLGILLIVFRLVGAVRLRESIRIMYRNLVNAREARQDRQRFENAQLMMREAPSFDARWKAVCTMAEDMGFEQVRLTSPSGRAAALNLLWRRASQDEPHARLVSVTIPLTLPNRSESARLAVTFKPNGSLEAAGTRVALFGRLIDENFPKAEVAEDGGDEVNSLPLFPHLPTATSSGTA